MPIWIAFAGNVAFVVTRALVPIVGVVLLGWSAPALLVVYFADTAASYYGFLAALALASARPEATVPRSVGERVGRAVRRSLRALLLPIPTLVLVGFFFGILPLFAMLEIQDVRWSELLADRGMWRGVALQFALALGLILQRRGPIDPSDPSVRRAGACLAARWLVMIFIGFFLAREIPRIVYGPLLIVAYALLTASLELAPDRVLAWARRVVS